MPALIPPLPALRESFLTAVEEFRAEGNTHFAGTTLFGAAGDENAEIWTDEMLADPLGFTTYTKRLIALADPDTPRPPVIVPMTTLWWAQGELFLGRLAIRHELTEPLLTWGGHIGYAVRPSARRQGHATAMLRESLPVAGSLGIDSVLVTCDTDNVASRRVIEAAGGAYQDTRRDKLRFWVPTA